MLELEFEDWNFFKIFMKYEIEHFRRNMLMKGTSYIFEKEMFLIWAVLNSRCTLSVKKKSAEGDLNFWPLTKIFAD